MGVHDQVDSLAAVVAGPPSAQIVHLPAGQRAALPAPTRTSPSLAHDWHIALVSLQVGVGISPRACSTVIGWEAGNQRGREGGREHCR